MRRTHRRQVKTVAFAPATIGDNNDFKIALCKLAEAETAREVEITGKKENSPRDRELCAVIEERWNRVIELADKHCKREVEAALRQDWKPGPELPPLRLV